MGILLLGIACRHRLIDEMNTIWGMKISLSVPFREKFIL